MLDDGFGTIIQIDNLNNSFHTDADKTILILWYTY